MSDPTTDESFDELPKKSGSKTPLLIAGLLVVNLAGTGFVAMKVLGQHAPPAQTAAHEENPVDKQGPVVPIDPFVVNLNETGNSRYLKAAFELEMTGEDAVAALNHAKRPVRDDLLRYLSSLSVADTLGETGKAKIQEQILARVDKHLGGGRVRKLFFTEFVVQ
jgi:flagellar FliL protein